MQKTYYHGSFTDDIQNFWPLTHFGTYEAAVICLNNAIERRDDNFNVITNGPRDNSLLKKYIYEVEMDFSNANNLIIEDILTPRPASLLRAIKSFGKSQLENIDNAIIEADNLKETSTSPHYRRKHLEARTAVQKFLLKNSIDYITYKNEVEALGSESIILINTSLIKSIKLINKI